MESADGWEGDLLCIPQVVSEFINLELCRPVSEEEIEGVVKSMPRDKAPGPDGIPVEFYINCWQTVTTDFIVTSEAFLSH